MAPQTLRSAPALASAADVAIGLELHFPNGGAIRPADLALLEAVKIHRSILAASKATGISYKKCWIDIDRLNRMFETAVVESSPGRGSGGSRITPFGERLMALYAAMQRQARKAAAGTLSEVVAALDPDFTLTPAPPP